MRRVHTHALWVAAILNLAGCEDGPTQVYSPSPDGASTRWNDGLVRGATDNSTAGYTEQGSVGTKQEICSGAEKQRRWAEAFRQPIKPPRWGAGLDFAGGEDWEGLLYEQAEHGIDGPNKVMMCQGDPWGVWSGEFIATWGDATEVEVRYLIDTHKIQQVTFNLGYQGTLDFKSRPGSRFGDHNYQMKVGDWTRRDGANFEFNWQDAKARDEQATELYDALMYTFAPELPSTQVNCVATQQCLARRSQDDTAVFGARGIGMYSHYANVSKGPRTSSAPDYLYMFVVKMLPFSNAAVHLKMDQEGPVATAVELGDKTPKSTCVMKLGTPYKDFVDQCINVLTDPALNQRAMNKWLGGHTHNDEAFIFNVVGVNFDFSVKNLDPFKIVTDAQNPADDDFASEFILDLRSAGPVINDTGPADPTTGVRPMTLKGTGAIYREYARIVQKDLTDRLIASGKLDPAKRRKIGDPACLFPADYETQPGFNAFAWRAPEGCTGFEGMLLPGAQISTDPDVNKLELGIQATRGIFPSALRPGDPVVKFCSDPGIYNYCGDGAEPVGFEGSVWDGSYQRVLQILGKGKVENLPTAARDRRYFFKLWAEAYVKYLRAAHLDPADMAGPEFDQYEADPSHLFFDAEGAGVERFEYVDRTFVSEGRGPLDIEYMVLIQSGNQQYTNYRSRMERPEKALYTAMQVDKTNPVGKEDNVWVTNVIGSPVLRDGWYPASDTKDAFYCATTEDAECITKGGMFNRPPRDKSGKMILDRKGRPWLEKYKGAFYETAFTLGTKHLKVLETFPYMQNAKVEVPNFSNPYDTTSPSTPIQLLTDYKPMQPQEGFPIPINGTRDKFIVANSLDFTGESITFRFDYHDAEDGHIELLAVETTDYMGDVFLCKDPLTGDLLSAQMYDSVQEIIDWIQAHPRSYDNCGLIVRYSPYNNYPDFIASVTNGVMLGINSGAGLGRVANVEMFIPGRF